MRAARASILRGCDSMRTIARAGGSLVLADFQVPPLRGSMMGCLHATAGLPMSRTIDFPCSSRPRYAEVRSYGAGVGLFTKVGDNVTREELIISIRCWCKQSGARSTPLADQGSRCSNRRSTQFHLLVDNNLRDWNASGFD